MKGYSEKEHFGAHALEYFYSAVDLVALLPEKDEQGRLLRCHEVARIVGSILGLEVVDGRYEYGCEHSWCIVPDKVGRGFSILDPYAVARIPPVQLVVVLPTIPNRYFPEAARDDIRQDVIDHLLKYFRGK